MPASADSGDIIVLSGQSAVEGASGPVDRVVFTARLFGGDPSSVDVTARFRTSPMHTTTQPGDAVQGTTCSGGVDFIAEDKTITIPANANPPEVTITVPICGDGVDEVNENFAGLLSSVVGADCLETCGAIGAITDDDAAPVPTLSVRDDNEYEGDPIFDPQRFLRFRVVLAPASNSVVRVQASTTLGDTRYGSLAKGGTSCSAGVDFVGRSVTLQFEPGETQKVVSVPICQDLTNEPNENLALVLSSPTNAPIGDGYAVGLILDDD